MHCTAIDLELFHRLTEQTFLDCRVLGVYQKAINFFGPDGCIITGVLHQAAPVPGGFSVFGTEQTDMLKQQRAIRLSMMDEDASCFTIVVDSVTSPVDFTLPPLRSLPKIHPSVFSQLADFLREHGPEGGITGLLPWSRWGFPTFHSATVPGQPGPGAEVLEYFLEQLSLGALLPETPILGLGIGLTPSSDDFVLGMLAVFHRYRHPLESVLKGCLSRQLSRTTPVSREMLRHALGDRYPLYVREFFHEVEYSRTPDPACLKEFLLHGHSSGTDLLCGILWGLRILCNGPHNPGQMNEKDDMKEKRNV